MFQRIAHVEAGDSSEAHTENINKNSDVGCVLVKSTTPKVPSILTPTQHTCTGVGQRTIRSSHRQFFISAQPYSHTSDAFKEYVWHRYKTQPQRTQCHSKGCLLHRHDARDINIYTYIYHSRCTREHTYTKKVNAMHVLCTKICQLTERFPQSQFSILSRQYSGGNINTPYCTIRQIEHRPRCTRPTRRNTRYSRRLDEPRQQHGVDRRHHRHHPHIQHSRARGIGYRTQ